MATSLLGALLVGAFLASCSTTLEERKAEQPAAYQSLAPSVRALVDKGHIDLGMSPNSVFVAWGLPSKVTTDASAEAIRVRWLYYRTRVEERPYWLYVPSQYGWGSYESRVEHRAVPYLRAEVAFENDQVVSWHLYRQPESRP